MRIDACFDSHVHWAATGEFSERLWLGELRTPSDILAFHPDRHHFRGEWLIGFGWDDNKWETQPTRAHLDAWFPNSPVALSRGDGHALWCNTEALRRAGLLENAPDIPGGRLERDPQGRAKGLLIDKACERVQNLIPSPSSFEVRRHLLEGIKKFNDAGYTHIRDMTCDEQQWNEAVRIDGTGLLTLAVEEYFWLKSSAGLESLLSFMSRAKADSPENLRVMGIKVFLDGALGSEGAWLSRCYCSKNHQGLCLWQEAELTEVLRKTWEKGFHVACHAIGDAAAEMIVDLCLRLRSQGIHGPLHIEHGELILPDTIEKMKGLSVEVHMQPAHWLSDRQWLRAKIGDLAEHAFPWRKLQEAEIPFDFGSDAPIAPASIASIIRALRESSESGIPRLLGSSTSYMSHRDPAWVPNCHTLIDEEIPTQVVFRGEHLI